MKKKRKLKKIEISHCGGEHASTEPDGVPLHAVRDDVDVNGLGLQQGNRHF